MSEKENKFVIRVYGLIVKNQRDILVTDEFRLGMRMTKFPGGGLMQGEGTVDCLKREIREECNQQDLINIEHFYTTDFYQKALFYDDHQLLSIYYLAELAQPMRFLITDKPFDFEENKEGSQSFRWIRIKELNPDDFSFPIDKFVAAKLRATSFEKN